MEYRRLGKTNFNISAISLGTWQVGGKWGSSFDSENAEKIINSAIDNGINFIDTADVYSSGLSEKAVGKVVKLRKEKVYVATKCGRKLEPHINSSYQTEVLKKFVEDSLKNMDIEVIDLIQLHCPPTEVYYRPEIFELFDRLKTEGKILNLGVSVEKIEEGIKAIEYPNVTTVQIIFNIFRQRPSELFFKEAAKKDIGIIVRVPLASGLLTGKYTESTKFDPKDHRNYNRDGAYFDKGETFAGVDYETGIDAVKKLLEVFPENDMIKVALKWILMFKEVSCVIPGASKPSQVLSNIEAVDYPLLNDLQMHIIQKIYDKYIKPHVHQRW
ncbi:MAG: aldo/keto reductase [Spirochaetes bacterium]|nr:aldo/keto reductase [Spirochaetota bacterium]